MKKLITAISVTLLMAALTACTPSNIEAVESAPVPEGAVIEVSKPEETKEKKKKEETKSTYSIPADAPTGVDGGPGMMETNEVKLDADYPEDKQFKGEEEPGTLVCLYALDYTGVYQTFDKIEMADANGLVEALVANAVLAEGTEVVSFSAENGAGKLELNQLKGVYNKAKEEQLVACVVNTFVENLGLDTLDLTAGGKNFGPMEMTSEYDAT